MSKKTARSWRLVLTTSTAMVLGIVLALNVGASADVRGSGPVADGPTQQSPSASPGRSPSGSPARSPSPSPEDTCSPIPPPICENETSAPPSASPSASPSTSPGPGGDETYRAKISIDYNKRKESFVGKVDSRAVCSKARRVDLFEVAPGKDQNRGHALTNNKSKYTIPFPDADGRFYTKARKSTPERNTTCKGAISKKIAV
jgi:hypothetical protein